MEHILHALYYLQMEQGEKLVPMDHPEITRHNGQAVEALIERRLVTREAGGLRLTEDGARAGSDIVRRHRLAERLMSDVLGIAPDAGDYIAGEMEHIVSSELTSSICTLLGHPTECPHGNPIPPGSCCEKGTQAVEPAVVPLSALRVGEKAVVAYLCGRAAGAGPPARPAWGIGRGHGRWGPPRPAQGPAARRCVAQLMSLGVFPGQEITLLQSSPAYVIRIGGTTLALDENVASFVRVRRIVEPK
ncbi:MAG: metal-dependent transcriptional regulator [Armatimonadetes bacterium]|nr:metal-dependent transcriptional regulator [Armatimonadota bacterium]